MFPFHVFDVYLNAFEQTNTVFIPINQVYFNKIN